jgi:hypothetical protein
MVVSSFTKIVRNPFFCRGIRVFAWVVDISYGTCAEARDGFEGVENIVRFLPVNYTTLSLRLLTKARKSLTRNPRPNIDVLGEVKEIKFPLCVCVYLLKNSGWSPLRLKMIIIQIERKDFWKFLPFISGYVYMMCAV